MYNMATGAYSKVSWCDINSPFCCVCFFFLGGGGGGGETVISTRLQVKKTDPLIELQQEQRDYECIAWQLEPTVR